MLTAVFEICENEGFFRIKKDIQKKTTHVNIMLLVNNMSLFIHIIEITKNIYIN